MESKKRKEEKKYGEESRKRVGQSKDFEHSLLLLQPEAHSLTMTLLRGNYPWEFRVNFDTWSFSFDYYDHYKLNLLKFISKADEAVFLSLPKLPSISST